MKKHSVESLREQFAKRGKRIEKFDQIMLDLNEGTKLSIAVMFEEANRNKQTTK